MKGALPEGTALFFFWSAGETATKIIQNFFDFVIFGVDLRASAYYIVQCSENWKEYGTRLCPHGLRE